MSNNAPDYENDLAFEPASADVRTTTIEKKLEIAIKALKDMARQCDLSWYQAKAEQTLKDIEELNK